MSRRQGAPTRRLFGGLVSIEITVPQRPAGEVTLIAGEDGPDGPPGGDRLARRQRSQPTRYLESGRAGLASPVWPWSYDFMTKRAWMSWSSGKDSAYALESIRSDPTVVVTGLLVTVNSDADRVAMHAVRRSLLEAQADRLGLPLHIVEIPSPCGNDVYETRMGAAMEEAARDGVEVVAFGDLFLDDVRAYREKALAGSGIRPVFPLWGRPTPALAGEMIARGVRAVLTCIDPTRLPESFVGRAFDDRLLEDLPAGIDPCGERGEFHTYVWDAPEFTSPIPVRTGEVVRRDGFVFCDVLSADLSVQKGRS